MLWSKIYPACLTGKKHIEHNCLQLWHVCERQNQIHPPHLPIPHFSSMQVSQSPAIPIYTWTRLEAVASVLSVFYWTWPDLWVPLASIVVYPLHRSPAASSYGGLLSTSTLQPSARASWTSSSGTVRSREVASELVRVTRERDLQSVPQRSHKHIDKNIARHGVLYHTLSKILFLMGTFRGWTGQSPLFAQVFSERPFCAFTFLCLMGYPQLESTGGWYSSNFPTLLGHWMAMFGTLNHSTLARDPIITWPLPDQ